MFDDCSEEPTARFYKDIKTMEDDILMSHDGQLLLESLVSQVNSKLEAHIKENL